jgi:hypothetical protein
MKKLIFSIIFSALLIAQSWAIDLPKPEAGRTQTLPTLTESPKGEVLLYWTEKDETNKSYLYYSVSKDKGQTFSDKILIFADAGLSASRLARPKILFKKDGSMVAFFSHRTGGSPTPPPAQKPAMDASHAAHDMGAKPAMQAPQSNKRDSQIKYVTSADGKKWSEPISVDTDTSRLTRGFFDATVLANGELAVAYLKDVKGSTKHEERDLRLAITKGGVFQPERLIDGVVCDCCNINLLVETDGKLNVYYRDNNDDVRDIAVLTSTDNGLTFKDSKIIHADKWEIKGCPHTGASSVITEKGKLIAWYSGTSNTATGVRVVDEQGNLLKVLDKSAKNAIISGSKKEQVLVWEQKNKSDLMSVYFAKIADNKVGDAANIESTSITQNPYALVVGGQKLLAFEEINSDKKSVLKLEVLK